MRQLSLRKLHRTLIFKRRKCRWSLLAQNWILSMKGRFLGRRSNHCQVGGAFRSTRHRQREIGTLQKFLKAYYDKCGSIIKQMGQGGEGVDEVVALLCEYLHRFPLYSMTYYDCDEFCMTYGLRCTRTLTILLTLRDCNVHRFYLTLFVCKVKNVRNDKHCQHILFFHPYPFHNMVVNFHLVSLLCFNNLTEFQQLSWSWRRVWWTWDGIRRGARQWWMGWAW